MTGPAPAEPQAAPGSNARPSAASASTSATAEIAVSVGIGLVRRGDRFLARRRPEGTVYAGYWEFPGGKCEPGELPDAATVRECLEETGMRVRVERLRRVVTHRYPHGLVTLHFFDCATERPDDGPDPNSGFQWMRAEELAALRFPEANDVVIAELVREHRPAPK